MIYINIFETLLIIGTNGLLVIAAFIDIVLVISMVLKIHDYYKEENYYDLGTHCILLSLYICMNLIAIGLIFK